MSARSIVDALKEAFNVCPECAAPWHLHWAYIFEAGERKRRWNTCGMTSKQIADKWLPRGAQP